VVGLSRNKTAQDAVCTCLSYLYFNREILRMFPIRPHVVNFLWYFSLQGVQQRDQPPANC
jgi:hypothetical protein